VKAVGLYHYLPAEDPQSLLDIELERPTPGPRDLLVRVEAVSVNPVDTKQRAPRQRTETEPRVLGWDAAGVVEEVGGEVSLFRPGDEVYYAGSITRGGSNCEYHLVDERIVGLKPRSLDFAEAAALPLTSLTAWEGLFDRLLIAPEAGASAGKSILIISAAGGVGSIATQLARHAGLTVIGTASRAETVAWAREHGAEHTVDHHQPLGPQLRELGFEMVDAIFCLNTVEPYWHTIGEIIAPQGRICAIVGTSKPLALGGMQYKSAAFAWEYMFTRAMFETPDMIRQHEILTRLAQLVDEGLINTTLNERLAPINAANLRWAHAKLESGTAIGKIVLERFG
jgi:zinc-binding alcohol dehydrogenase family protein